MIHEFVFRLVHWPENRKTVLCPRELAKQAQLTLDLTLYWNVS